MCLKETEIDKCQSAVMFNVNIIMDVIKCKQNKPVKLSDYTRLVLVCPVDIILLR